MTTVKTSDITDDWDVANKERPKPHVLNEHHLIPKSWVAHMSPDEQAQLKQETRNISPTAHINTHHLIDRFVRVGGPDNVPRSVLRRYTKDEIEMAVYAWGYRPSVPTITSLYNSGHFILRGGHAVSDPRLGRVPHFDPRSREYPVSRLLEERGLSNTPRNRKWSSDTTLDQEQTSECVGFSWTTFADTTPRRVKPDLGPSAADTVYDIAQDLDEIPGRNYEGSTNLGGAKAMMQLGRIKSYYWVMSVEELMLALSHHGPVVLGINWYNNMFEPDPKTGLITVGGGIAGGHNICADAIDITKERIRLHQTWGADWGLNGYCWVDIPDVERLLSENGDGCVALKVVPEKVAA